MEGFCGRTTWWYHEGYLEGMWRNMKKGCVKRSLQMGHMERPVLWERKE